MTGLPVFEEVIDASGAAARIEVLLPVGVRPRQLRVRTLLAGMCLAQADHRPAHLTRVHQALTALSDEEQRRLGVLADWKHGPHQLTYRQTERTFGLVASALGKDEPDGLPSPALQAICDDLLEASVPEEFKDTSRSLAVDWTDLESFSRPPPAKGGPCADPQASWGHRKNNLLRSEDELFYGWYLSAGAMVPEENKPAIPELADSTSSPASASMRPPDPPAMATRTPSSPCRNGSTWPTAPTHAGQKLTGTCTPPSRPIVHHVTLPTMFRSDGTRSTNADRNSAKQYELNAINTISGTAASAIGNSSGTPKIGASTNSAMVALAVPLISHCTLRPTNTTNGPVGAAMSSGSVPVPRSHVDDAVTNAASIVTITTALPISR